VFPDPTTILDCLVAGIQMSHKHASTTLDGWDVTKAVTFSLTLPCRLAVGILARQMDALWILPSFF
jgi:hypothetical protein